MTSSCSSEAAWIISEISASRTCRPSAGWPPPAAADDSSTSVGRKRLPARSKKWWAAAASTGWSVPTNSRIDTSSGRSCGCTSANGSVSDAGAATRNATVMSGQFRSLFCTAVAADRHRRPPAHASAHRPSSGRTSAVLGTASGLDATLRMTAAATYS
eukprot:scaffold14437_cov124-Isochrysis_galbana.AAC.5